MVSHTLMWSSVPTQDVLPITGVPTMISGDGNSDAINISAIETLMASVEVGAPTGTTPTLTFYMDVLDALGNWLQVLALTQLTGASYTYAAVGPGSPTPYVLTNRARFRWDSSPGSSWPDVAVALAGH